MARVAAPTVEAERNVSSSPVGDSVSEVCPLGGGYFVPGNRARARRVTDEPPREKDQRHLQDCAAGRDLHRGDTPRIQHQGLLHGLVTVSVRPPGLRLGS